MVGPVENGKKNMKLPNAVNTSITSQFVNNFFFPELNTVFMKENEWKCLPGFLLEVFKHYQPKRDLCCIPRSCK